MEYFRKMSQIEHEVPDVGRRRFKATTFKKWLHIYRNGGFETLKPNTRADKGASRRIAQPLADIIKEKFKQFPYLSVSAIYRLLIAEGQIMPGTFNEGTLRKYVKDNNLKNTSEAQPRKKFEKEHINELWIADSMHGPYITHEKRKQQTFLISIIDDCSRVIVGSQFFFHENSLTLQVVLKQALSRFGLPQVLYTDNGSIFVSQHLQLACARLGIALVHSKPYDSPSRGKIERWHRTVRQKFLPLCDLPQIHCLDDFNYSFCSWLDKDYQKSFHKGINNKPLDKWMDDLTNISLKRVSAHELDQAFFMTITRKVKNDSTVSVNGALYEVQPRFIGKKIQVRYPIDNPQDLHLYEDNNPVGKLKRLNPIENANPPAWAIKFHKGDSND